MTDIQRSEHPMAVIGHWFGVADAGMAAGLGIAVCVFAVGAAAGVAVWLMERREQEKLYDAVDELLEGYERA
ncbi:MAG: hypothetical protein ACPHVN_00090 [Luminiphilus sp.]